MSNESRFSRMLSSSTFLRTIWVLESIWELSGNGWVISIIISKLKKTLIRIWHLSKLVLFWDFETQSKQKHKQNLFGYLRPLLVRPITPLNFGFSFLVFCYCAIILVSRFARDPIMRLRDAVKKNTSYSVTLSLLPLTPTLPRLKVTSLISDKVVFWEPPPSLLK